jgi:hypothetical protein
MSAEYQIGFLGASGEIRAELKRELANQSAILGLAPAALTVLDEPSVPTRERKRPFIAVFFGYAGADDASHPVLKDLLRDSVVILPIVPSLKGATGHIPSSLAHINCVESSPAQPNVERLVTVLFENFRLLRAERRLFISYRRAESQGVAIQIYETLDALGFDVFLDTRSVPAAKDFQSILWHRLADSDIVLLLGTPQFRTSRWTVEELARANATGVHILHFLWPGQSSELYTAFHEFVRLQPSDFINSALTGAETRFSADLVNRIGTMVEGLRARAMAFRYRYLVDNFCDQARSLGQDAAVQATRYIALTLKKVRRIAVVPAVGVPNAERYQEIERAISTDSTKFEKIWLLYDERGILQGSLEHLEWLNRHLPVSAVRVSDALGLMAKEAT